MKAEIMGQVWATAAERPKCFPTLKHPMRILPGEAEGGGAPAHALKPATQRDGRALGGGSAQSIPV